jgi:hypothetical protein
VTINKSPSLQHTSQLDGLITVGTNVEFLQFFNFVMNGRDLASNRDEALILVFHNLGNGYKDDGQFLYRKQNVIFISMDGTYRVVIVECLSPAKTQSFQFPF